MDTMDAIVENVPLAASRTTKASLRKRAVNFLAAIRWSMELNRTRVSLSELSDEHLRDIGLSRQDAERECRKIGLL